MNPIIRAATFAAISHEGQYRKYSRVPYIVRPFRVAGWTAALSRDENATCAAHLHDVIEDCGVTELEIRGMFNPAVAALVVELTNPSKEHPELPRKERKAMDREHLLHISPTAKLIKLIDRWDNLNDMPLDNPDAKRFLRQHYLAESHMVCEILMQEPDVACHVEHINLPQLIESLSVTLKVKLPILQ
jgi:guanosine-3',5'-bis(diphosphate) 3'-pyrophosphohydrolase